LILIDSLFLLEQRKRREGKKKEKEITMGEECFPRAGPTLLAVQWIAAVKYN
jgi:hypothetical protein